MVARLFGEYGEVTKVTLVTDRDTGKLRGFGFVEMPDAEALQAVSALDGFNYEGSALRINESRDRGDTPPRRSW